MQPIPEKPQRTKMVIMGTKRVLDDSALSGHDYNDNDYDNESGTGRSKENSMCQEGEPIDVFNPVRRRMFGGGNCSKNFRSGCGDDQGC